MIVTVTEFKQNQKKYLEKSSEEDVLISKEGKIIARITSPFKEVLASAHALRGVLPNDVDVDAIQKERLSKI